MDVRCIQIWGVYGTRNLDSIQQPSMYSIISTRITMNIHLQYHQSVCLSIHLLIHSSLVDILRWQPSSPSSTVLVITVWFIPFSFRSSSYLGDHRADCLYTMCESFTYIYSRDLDPWLSPIIDTSPSSHLPLSSDQLEYYSRRAHSMRLKAWNDIQNRCIFTELWWLISEDGFHQFVDIYKGTNECEWGR